MSEKLRLQEPIRSPLETPRLITPLPYRSGTSFLAWAIVNNNQPVPDVFSKMTKITASGRLGQTARRYTRNAGAGGFQRARRPKVYTYPKTHFSRAGAASPSPALPLAGIERTAHRELYPCAAADPAPLGRCIDLRQQRAIETEHHRRLARLGPLPRLVGLGRDRLGLRLGRPGNEGIGRRLIHRRLGLAVRFTSDSHRNSLRYHYAIQIPR